MVLMMDRATVSPFGKNNNLLHLAGRRGRGPRHRETLLNLSVSECGVQRSREARERSHSHACLLKKKIYRFQTQRALCCSPSSASPQHQCFLWKRKTSEECESLLGKKKLAVKNGAAFTHANAEAAELRLRTGAADRTMQHGSRRGFKLDVQQQSLHIQLCYQLSCQ